MLSQPSRAADDMEFNSEFFEHSPLEDARSQIRLIRLLPGAEEADLCCELETYAFNQTLDSEAFRERARSDQIWGYQAFEKGRHLFGDIMFVNEVPDDKELRYQAISYVWGDANDLRSIVVDGKRLVVRYNCWDALRQMRNYVVNHGQSPLLWMDAICINQQDLVEKSAQVQMMGDIFAWATLVVICPGPPGDDTEIVQQQLEAFVEIQKRSPLYRDDDGQRQYVPIIPAIHDWLTMLGESQCIQLILAVCKFGSRPYWSRAWIVQETRLARRTILLAGRAPIPFLRVLGMLDEFATATSFDTADRGRLSTRKRNFAMRNPYLKDILGKAGLDGKALFELPMHKSLVGSKRSYEKSAIPFSLETLERMPQLQCSEVRDRIFALIRLLKWSPRTGPPNTSYTKDVLEVAMDVVMRADPQARGIDLTLGVLRALQISNARLAEYFPVGITPGCLNAIMWRSENGPITMDLCAQCRLEKSRYKLKVEIHEWAPIQQSIEGYLTVPGRNKLRVQLDPTESQAAAEYFGVKDATFEDSPSPESEKSCPAADIAADIATSTSIERLDPSFDTLQIEETIDPSQSTPTVADTDKFSTVSFDPAELFPEPKHCVVSEIRKMMNAIIPLILTPNKDAQYVELDKIGIASSRVQSGDIIVCILDHFRASTQQACRHLVLRQASDDLYKIIGHAWLPSHIRISDWSTSWKSRTDYDDYEDEDENSWKPRLHLSIDLEDTIAYILSANEPRDWRQQVESQFCLSKMSSFGKMRPYRQADSSGGSVDDIDMNHTTARGKDPGFCLNCGRDLSKREESEPGTGHSHL